MTIFGLSNRRKSARRALAFRPWAWESDSGKPGHSRKGPEAQKRAALADDSFPQCHGLPGSRGPRARHQPCLSIVTRSFAFVKLKVSGQPSLVYLRPCANPGRSVQSRRATTTTLPAPNQPCAPRSPQRGRRGGGAQGRAPRDRSGDGRGKAPVNRAAVDEERGSRPENRPGESGRPPTPPPGSNGPPGRSHDTGAGRAGGEGPSADALPAEAPCLDSAGPRGGRPVRAGPGGGGRKGAPRRSGQQRPATTAGPGADPGRPPPGEERGPVRPPEEPGPPVAASPAGGSTQAGTRDNAKTRRTVSAGNECCSLRGGGGASAQRTRRNGSRGNDNPGLPFLGQLVRPSGPFRDSGPLRSQAARARQRPAPAAVGSKITARPIRRGAGH